MNNLDWSGLRARVTMFTANDNPIFHERVGNYARAMQNLREEGARLRIWYFQEIQGSQHFVDTEGSTTSEVADLINYMDSFRKLNENEAVSADSRHINLIPFLAHDPQI